MFGLGGQEILLILLIVLLLFGPKKIPELARGLGKGIQEFKKAQSNLQDEFNKAVEEEPKNEKKA
jgi:sec-independent protein translocase protein TatA